MTAGFYYGALSRPDGEVLAADEETRELVAFELHQVALGAVDRANIHLRHGYGGDDHTVCELRELASRLEVRADAYRAVGAAVPAEKNASTEGSEEGVEGPAVDPYG